MKISFNKSVNEPTRPKKIYLVMYRKFLMHRDVIYENQVFVSKTMLKAFYSKKSAEKFINDDSLEDASIIETDICD